MLRLGLTIALWAAHGTAAPAKPPSEPGARVRRLPRRRLPRRREGAARGRSAEKLRNEDWAAFLLGESEFYDGDYRAARAAFERAAQAQGGRPAAMAPFRIADCLWMEGDRARRRPRPTRSWSRRRRRPPPTSRWRAFGSPRRRRRAIRPARQKQFLAIAREFPAHPLADEALRRAGAPVAPRRRHRGAGTRRRPTTEISRSPTGSKRAESLTKDRHWDEALAELARLPAELPPEQAAERDYQIGMTKFHMRRDYAKAGELLLATAPHLSGDKAASAAFHGARALSRVDRDDEAIAGYRKVVAEFPHSRYAAEAQYLSGWLEYNRGRFKESLPALQATLDHFGTSAFADDAAWCLAFAHFLLGRRRRGDGRARALRAHAGDRHHRRRARRSRRLLAGAVPRQARAKDDRPKAEALEGYRDAGPPRAAVVLRSPGARAPQGGGSATVPVALPPRRSTGAPPARPARDPIGGARRELADAGMDAEAGGEIERDEKGILQRAGRREGGRAGCWSSTAAPTTSTAPTSFAESHDAGALAADPHGDAGVRVFWEAAFPRAYAPLVDRYGPPAGNPELYLYAIMRKESGFDPHDVSYADARGLLQMIPPTSARVAAEAGRAVLPRPALRPRGEHPARRALHRRALQEVRRRGAAGGRRLQRRAARDGALVHAARRRTPPTSSSSWSPSRRRASTSSASPASTPSTAFSTAPRPTRSR